MIKKSSIPTPQIQPTSPLKAAGGGLKLSKVQFVPNDSGFRETAVIISPTDKWHDAERMGVDTNRAEARLKRLVLRQVGIPGRYTSGIEEQPNVWDARFDGSPSPIEKGDDFFISVSGQDLYRDTLNFQLFGRGISVEKSQQLQTGEIKLVFRTPEGRRLDVKFRLSDFNKAEYDQNAGGVRIRVAVGEAKSAKDFFDLTLRSARHGADIIGINWLGNDQSGRGG